VSQDPSEPKGEPFLSTLTGLLTAIGGVITAIGALVAALFATNVIGPEAITTVPSPVVITATVLPTSSPPVISTPTGGVLLDETFSDSGSGWDTYADNDMETGYQDGEFRIAVLQNDITTWTTPTAGQGFADYTVEVDARQVEGPLDSSFGLVVRVQPDDENLYRFAISADGYYVVDLYQNGQWTTLKDWEASEAIHQGLNAVNRLWVVCDRSKFSFYVNDAHLADLIDNTFSSGQIGLTVGSSPEEGGVVVHFDNLRVLPLEQP
jgi:hypothetical protein